MHFFAFWSLCVHAIVVAYIVLYHSLPILNYSRFRERIKNVFMLYLANVTSGAGTAYPSNAYEFITFICGFHGAGSLIFCVVFCRQRFLFCSIPWDTPRNWQWEPIKNETSRQKRSFQFPIVNFLFICSNIPAMIFKSLWFLWCFPWLVDCCCEQWSHWTKDS